MPLSVSTNCPSCGGGLEFEPGTNAVHCPFCGSDHLVTGRGRVLAYYVPDNIDAREAVRVAMGGFRETGEHGWRPSGATLFFVPFYHYTAQALRWEVQEVRPAAANGTNIRITVLGSVGADELLSVISGTGHQGAPGFAEKRFELEGRLLDRSLPALDAPELGVFSLGIRPEVLKLSLFEHSAVASRGIVVPVKFTADQLEEEGYEPVNPEELFSRGLVAKVRSLIYFPFWLVEVARLGHEGEEGAASLVVVDAVAGDVTRQKANIGLLDKLVNKDGDHFEQTGFRPLKCPDCGNGLPVRPRDVVFFCPGCNKAWQVDGSEFTEVPCSVAAPASKHDQKPVYLPFWVVKAHMESGDRVIDNKFDLAKLVPALTWPKPEDKEVPFRFFVPAFQMGNMKALTRLASSFTRFQPVFDHAPLEDGVFRGSYITAEDALALAPLILFSLIPKGNRNAVQFALDAKVEPLGAELALVPFYQGRFEMTEGLFGQSIPLAAIKD
jgi:predicted RNA-binding Zn-ribbon protein involved in translation (DUF1610 family)